MLIPLVVKPGLYSNGTRQGAAGRWYDANGVRWYQGKMGPIGGWTPLQETSPSVVDVTVSGVPRFMFAWRGSDAAAWLSIGTHTKLYAYSAGAFADITPVSFTAGTADATFAGTAGQYGKGAYGSGPYGSGSASSVPVDPATWQIDNFGDYLIASCTSDGKVLVWDRNLANKAIQVTGSPPTGVSGVVVTPERFVFALGTTGNTRRVSWASQETYDTWTPSGSNTAGDFDIASTGRLMAGRRSRNETIIWTDTDLWIATYIGGVFVYGFRQAGASCGAIAPNAMCVVNGVAYWMGSGGFFSYTGYVQQIPCDVYDKVFGDLNRAQQAKIVCIPNAQQSEVTWRYPSGAALEIDRYVTYNYLEGHWSAGTLSRTAGVDRGEFTFPIYADASGNVYEHERGNTRTGLAVYAETGPIALDSGENVYMVRQLMPDESALGDVRYSIKSQLYPTDAETTDGPYTVAQPTDVRLTARFMRLRLDEVAAADWRFGILRVDAVPGGSR